MSWLGPRSYRNLDKIDEKLAKMASDQQRLQELKGYCSPGFHIRKSKHCKTHPNSFVPSEKTLRRQTIEPPNLSHLYKGIFPSPPIGLERHLSVVISSDDTLVAVEATVLNSSDNSKNIKDSDLDSYDIMTRNYQIAAPRDEDYAKPQEAVNKEPALQDIVQEHIDRINRPPTPTSIYSQDDNPFDDRHAADYNVDDEDAETEDALEAPSASSWHPTVAEIESYRYRPEKDCTCSTGYGCRGGGAGSPDSWEEFVVSDDNIGPDDQQDGDGSGPEGSDDSDSGDNDDYSSGSDSDSDSDSDSSSDSDSDKEDDEEDEGEDEDDEQSGSGHGNGNGHDNSNGNGHGHGNGNGNGNGYTNGYANGNFNYHYNTFERGYGLTSRGLGQFTNCDQDPFTDDQYPLQDDQDPFGDPPVCNVGAQHSTSASMHSLQHVQSHTAVLDHVDNDTEPPLPSTVKKCHSSRLGRAFGLHSDKSVAKKSKAEKKADKAERKRVRAAKKEAKADKKRAAKEEKSRAFLAGLQREVAQMSDDQWRRHGGHMAHW